MIAVLAACSGAERGGAELLGDDSSVDVDDSAPDDTSVTHGIADDSGGLTGNGDDSGKTDDSGSTGGTVDTAGDCPVTIPKDVVVIADDAYLKEDGIVAYVCKNKVLSMIGSNATVYVATGGNLWMNSSGNTIYAKSGADLAFYDSDNEVYVEDGVSVEDDSKDATLPLVICTSITYENEPDC
jgi:hypothetical protein